MHKNIGMVLITVSLLIGCGINHYQGTESPDSDQQMISFLQEYIRINTTHPTPDYERALAFLKKYAEKDGFLYQQVCLPSGKKVLVITYPGTAPELPALALNHHMDVVPAPHTTQWVKPPFAAEIHEGSLIGRGTQDMKGIAALHYFALKTLKDAGIKVRRTIYLFAVPDEEIGGFTGTQEFVETDFFKKLNVGYIVDEGHASGDAQSLDIKVTERKPLQIKITSKGTLAHGSRLMCHNAIHELVTLLERFVKLHTEQQKCAHTQQPGQLISYNITSLSAGMKKDDGHTALNMVPECAEATLDIRVPPCIKRVKVIAYLDELIQQYPATSYTILAQAREEPEPTDYQTELFHALSNTIASFGLQARPHFFEASSDLRFYLVRGIQGVGFTPFTVEDNIHGTNESVPLDQLIRGKEIVVQFLKDFAG